MVTPADLDAALEFHGVGLESGEILLLRTGWSEHYLAMTPEEQDAFPPTRWP